MTNEEINQAVAIKLGWTHDPREDLTVGGKVVDQTWRRGKEAKRGNEGMFTLGFRYCTDIAAAWEIVEKEKCTHIGKCESGWTCSIWPSSKEYQADTAMMAICLSFLKLEESK